MTSPDKPTQLLPDHVSAFSEARPGEQIEWSEAEVLKLAEVGTEAEKEVRERMGPGVDGRRRCESGREVGIGWGVGRTGAERGEPCRVCELW
jgi:hypothetical protein